MTLEQFAQELSCNSRLIRHADLGGPIRSAAELAQALGCEPARVCKTLLLRSDSPEKPFLAVLIPAPAKADFAKVADVSGAAKPHMASIDDIREVLHTVPNAVSPFRLAGVPLYVDAQILDGPTVYVSSGDVGADIEIPPEDLVRITGAKVGNLV